MRDVSAIGNKFYHVFIPKNNNKLLKECLYYYVNI